jgi:hypothetical protein
VFRAKKGVFPQSTPAKSLLRRSALRFSELPLVGVENTPPASGVWEVALLTHSAQVAGRFS